MKALSPQHVGTIEMLLCATLWSIAGIFLKQIPWNPLVIAGFRSLIAGLTLFIFMCVTHIRFQLSRPALWNGLFVCLTYLAFVTANKLTTAANAIVLQFTAPVFILLFSAVLFGQKFSRRDILAVLITLLGISLFFFDQLDGGRLIGNLVSILSGALMAAMYLAIGRAAPDERMSGALLGNIFTALVGISASLIVPPQVTPRAVVSLVTLGVVQLGIPFILLARAMSTCPPIACALIGAIEPLLNPIWVFLFDGEAPGPFALFGAVIVIAAITIWTISRERSPDPPSVVR